MLLDGHDENEAFVSEVCWHYYVNEMTQAEVAVALGVTRLRVNQAIQRAKSLGIVKVRIESPFLARLDLLAVDRSTAELAVSLGGSYRLRAADAVHLATAVTAGADRFLTNNRRDFPREIDEIEIVYPEMLGAEPG